MIVVRFPFKRSDRERAQGEGTRAAANFADERQEASDDLKKNHTADDPSIRYM